MRSILQLGKDISKLIQKLLTCFNGTAVLIFFVLPSAGVFPIILILDLSDPEFTIAARRQSLLDFHKLPDVFQEL